MIVLPRIVAQVKHRLSANLPAALQIALAAIDINPPSHI
jgi:hypothetical protein